MRTIAPAVSRRTAAAVGATALATLVLATGAAQAEPTPTRAEVEDSGLVLAADPEAVTIAPLPCDRRGEIELSMTNTGSTGRFVDALFHASDPLATDRGIWSTYLPAADPVQPVTAPIRVTAETGTSPGEYQLWMDAGEEHLEIPVTVEPPPGDGPTDNLALYRQEFASTVHPNTTLCGGVDGDTDSSTWAAGGIHDRTPEEFPDTFGVQLDHSYVIRRVEVYTLDSAKYPAAQMGIRDVDVQAHTRTGWRTVGSVRGNEEGQITVTFRAVRADQVRLVVRDSNDHKYSRLIELEVYQR